VDIPELYIRAVLYQLAVKQSSYKCCDRPGLENCHAASSLRWIWPFASNPMLYRWWLSGSRAHSALGKLTGTNWLAGGSCPRHCRWHQRRPICASIIIFTVFSPRTKLYRDVCWWFVYKRRCEPIECSLVALSIGFRDRIMQISAWHL